MGSRFRNSPLSGLASRLSFFSCMPAQHPDHSRLRLMYYFKYRMAFFCVLTRKKTRKVRVSRPNPSCDYGTYYIRLCHIPVIRHSPPDPGIRLSILDYYSLFVCRQLWLSVYFPDAFQQMEDEEPGIPNAVVWNDLLPLIVVPHLKSFPTVSGAQSVIAQEFSKNKTRKKREFDHGHGDVHRVCLFDFDEQRTG